MSHEIEFVVVEENDSIFIQIGHCALGEEKLVETATFEPEQEVDGPEYGVLAAVAKTSENEGSFGRALEELVAWAFQLGRQHPLPPELDRNELSGCDPRDDSYFADEIEANKESVREETADDHDE